MHDAIIGERYGVPSVAVLTAEFVSAGKLMGRVLGATDYMFATIPHPISSASDLTLAAHADHAAAKSVQILCAEPSAG